MAVRRTRRAQATLTDLILRTAIYVGDVVDGARPAAGDRKWEDSAIVVAINDMMSEMYLELHMTPDQVLQSVTVVYTGGAEELEIANNDATGIPIYALYEETSGKPNLLRYIGFPQIERYRTDGSDPALGVERVWAQRDEFILLRPIPTSNVDLTIVFIGHPFGMDAAFPTDQHPFPVAHEELLILGAANRLQYPNDQLPIGRQIHYNKLWQKWQMDCDRYQGPKSPADVRRWR